jgi:hypothetical protein
MQTTGVLWIKYDIISFKIWLFYFCNIFLVDASQKNPFFALRKMKNEFFMQSKLKLPNINIVCHLLPPSRNIRFGNHGQNNLGYEISRVSVFAPPSIRSTHSLAT